MGGHLGARVMHEAFQRAGLLPSEFKKLGRGEQAFIVASVLVALEEERKITEQRGAAWESLLAGITSQRRQR